MKKKRVYSITKQYLFVSLSLFVEMIGVYATPVFPSDTISVNVSRFGRKIQHDGFLMEWGMKTARPWDSSGNWIWDATATSEGLAGYIRSKNVPTCKEWTFSAHSSSDNRSSKIQLPHDSTITGKELRLDREEFHANGNIIVEWLFPIKKESHGSETPITITLTGKDSCGDTLPVLHLILPTSTRSSKSVITPKIIRQSILIIVLLVLYVTMMRRIRRQTRQTGSPRQ